jgi:undecaprenyl-diphosphatase
MQRILGLSGNEVALSVVLHLGTVLALLVFFFKDILGLLGNLKLLLYIAIVTVTTGIIGVAGRDFFEGLFSSVGLVAIAWIFTGIILILTKQFMSAKRSQLNIKDAIILGFTQAIAIIPGVSRSGITISALLFRKIDRETSFRFSFLAAIPAVCGAALLEARKINLALRGEYINFMAGFIFSFLVGLFSLWVLKLIIQRAKLHYFGYYCILAAILVLLFVR